MHLSPDELVYAVTPINIISTGKISTFHQSPVYFYLTDIGYKLFGVNAITSRLVGIIFGTLIIVVVYLLAKEILKEERAALLAAFFFAISAYAIIHNTEMDGITFFFMLASVLFYIKGLQSNDKYFFLAAVFLGLAILNKALALLLVPVYIAYYVAYHHGVPLPRRRIQIIGMSMGIILVMLLPVFAYNVLLYQEKNTLDIFFSLYVPSSDKSSYADLGIDKPWTGQRFIEVAEKRIYDFLTLDPFLFLLGLSGLGWMIKRKEKFIGFFVAFLLLYTIFMWGKAGGGGRNHQVLYVPLLAIFASYAVWQFSKYVSQKITTITTKKIFLGIIGVTLLFAVGTLADELTQKSALVQLREVVDTTMEDSALVIADARIYTGNQAWVLHDTAYFDAALLPEVVKNLEQDPGEKRAIRTYYIECVTKDCGWGRGIKDDQNIQRAAEELTAPFREQGVIVAEITDEKDHYRIYQTDMLLNPLIFLTAEATEWFYNYPVGWKGKHQGNAFDEYDPTKFLHKLGKVVLYLDLLLVFCSALFIFYFIWKENAVNKKNQQQTDGVFFKRQTGFESQQAAEQVPSLSNKKIPVTDHETK